jgi:hypothetical protein
MTDVSGRLQDHQELERNTTIGQKWGNTERRDIRHP